jgi:hypothetical protein
LVELFHEPLNPIEVLAPGARVPFHPASSTVTWVPLCA